MTSIVLFRKDLRLADNPALYAAAERGTVLPLYIASFETKAAFNSDDLAEDWPMGAASRWWLHHSLTALDKSLREYGSSLHIGKSHNTAEYLLALCQHFGADAVFWNRRYAPAEIQADKTLKSQLQAAGITVQSFNGNLLNEPWEVFNKQSLPYKVFTPYWRECRNHTAPPTPLPIPAFNSHERSNASELAQSDISKQTIASLQLLPTKPDWSSGLDERWQPGEQAAQKKWELFLENAVTRYDKARNFPAIAGTSYLSPHLAFGEISPRQIWHDIVAQSALGKNDDMERYLSEIGWREFSYYQLYHFPRILNDSFNPRFDHFAWQDDPEQIATQLSVWQQGLTGYPIVDAGMRELWHTGYMHNRVRMIAASFLCKDLLLHWRAGAEWFWDTLVDADLASNTASWQWTAGCGADAAPFFRIFNPITQGEKFDADGEYTRQWVPELALLPKKYLQKPWTAPSHVLEQAGVQLGQNYPLPIVDHKVAREMALERFKDLKTHPENQ